MTANHPERRLTAIPRRRLTRTDQLRVWSEGLRYGDPPWARTATILFIGGSDLFGGIAGLASLHDAAPAYTYAAAWAPMWAWWLGFVAVGLLVLNLLRDPTRIGKIGIIGAFYGGVWTAFVAQTIGSPHVTWRAFTVPFFGAIGHLLLRLFRPHPTTRR